MPSNIHVFVDFENVHQIDLSIIGSKSVCITLLLGAQQTRLDATLVEKLMEYANSVQLVRLTSSGKNALDFALAYYVGRAAMADPTAYFHIISRDTGFDPLIEHLKSRHLRALRHADFSTLTFSPQPKPSASSKEGMANRVLEYLRKNTKNRPKRMKTLQSHIKAFAGNGATEEGVLKLIQSLKSAGHISIDANGGVTYIL